MTTRCPDSLGFRADSTGETAQAAAELVKSTAATFEAACLHYVRQGPFTPDEAHARLERELGHRVNLYSVRPRFSALKAKGLVVDGGEWRAPPGGCKAVVWRAATVEELALFHARKAAAAEKFGGGN